MTHVAPRDPSRARLLEQYVSIYLQDGYEIERREEYSVELVRRKGFSLIAFVLFSVLYIAYYFGQRDEHLKLWLGRDGKLRKTRL